MASPLHIQKEILKKHQILAEIWSHIGFDDVIRTREAKNTDFHKTRKIMVFDEFFFHRMKDYDKIPLSRWFLTLFRAFLA